MVSGYAGNVVRLSRPSGFDSRLFRSTYNTQGLGPSRDNEYWAPVHKEFRVNGPANGGTNIGGVARS